jgi:hypothetical protein
MAEIISLVDTCMIKQQLDQDCVPPLAAEGNTPRLPVSTTRQSTAQPLKTSGVDIMALREHHCRWPLVRKAGEAQAYCGHYRSANVSYCVTHAKISYAPAQSRQRMPKAS